MGGGPAAATQRAWWWPVALPAALTGAAWLIQVLVSADLPGWGRAVLVVAGTLSALLAFALPARQLAAERRTRDAAEQLASEALATYKIKVHDMLIPLSLTVGRRCRPPGPRTGGTRSWRCGRWRWRSRRRTWGRSAAGPATTSWPARRRSGTST